MPTKVILERIVEIVDSFFYFLEAAPFPEMGFILLIFDADYGPNTPLLVLERRPEILQEVERRAAENPEEDWLEMVAAVIPLYPARFVLREFQEGSLSHYVELLPAEGEKPTAQLGNYLGESSIPISIEGNPLWVFSAQRGLLDLLKKPEEGEEQGTYDLDYEPPPYVLAVTDAEHPFVVKEECHEKEGESPYTGTVCEWSGPEKAGD